MTVELPTPESRKEVYLAKAAGEDVDELPVPASREELYLNAIAQGAGGIEGRVVETLPDEGEAGYIYLILKESGNAGDIYDEYMWVLLADGETHGWEHIGATNEVSIKLYDAPGSNTDGAMTQYAATQMIFQDPTNRTKIHVGAGTVSSQGNDSIGLGVSTKATGNTSIAIGHDAEASGGRAIAIGDGSSSKGLYSVALGDGSEATTTCSIAIGGQTSSGFHTKATGDTAIAISGGSTTASGAYSIAISPWGATASGNGSIALGTYASATAQGEMNIGTTSTSYGYANTNYRLLSGVHDGQGAHDAVTVGQVNALIDAINTATSSNISHIGA